MVLTIPQLVEIVPSRRRAADNDPGPLARLLIRRRGERGWLQREVAPRAGFSQGYYSSLETGAIQRPGKDKLAALDRAFDLEVGTFANDLERVLREQGPPYDIGPEWIVGEDGGLIRILPYLSPERQRALADYAKWLAEQENAS